MPRSSDETVVLGVVAFVDLRVAKLVRFVMRLLPCWVNRESPLVLDRRSLAVE